MILKCTSFQQQIIILIILRQEYLLLLNTFLDFFSHHKLNEPFREYKILPRMSPVYWINISKLILYIYQPFYPIKEEKK